MVTWLDLVVVWLNVMIARFYPLGANLVAGVELFDVLVIIAIAIMMLKSRVKMALGWHVRRLRRNSAELWRLLLLRPCPLRILNWPLKLMLIQLFCRRGSCKAPFVRRSRAAVLYELEPFTP